MSGKNEAKTNNRKISIGSVPVNQQRSPSSKHTNKIITVNNDGKDENAINKMDGNGPLTAANKPSPAKTSRNQVSANWNSVAGTLKSQRTIPPNKKNGKYTEFRCVSDKIIVTCSTIQLFETKNLIFV